jgi:pyruvate dehydrogenase E2 component (dihydrolipoyllysine-residue acetyltransferase)
MAHSIVMPALEMAQENGKLLAWRKKEGEAVAKGEPLLEVETDKAVVEVEAPADGILAGIRASVGETIAVGTTIAWIVSPGETPPAEAPAAATARRTTASPMRTPAAGAAPEATVAPGLRISPKARRLASEHGIDLTRVHGSGPEGEILAEDILALAASAKAPSPVPVESLSPVARLMAERTTESWTHVPHFFVAREVDAAELVAARERWAAAPEKTGGERVTHTDLLVALAAQVLVKHPRLNASWTEVGIRPGGQIRENREVNIGVAIAVEDGVVAGTIPSAHTKKLGEIAKIRRELAERAQANRLRPQDISGATFTISNLGMYKVDAFSAIIVQPQAAILAVGQIAEHVVAREGKPCIRPTMALTLSCDHRVVDGAKAARFLNDLAEAILDPEKRLR